MSRPFENTTAWLKRDETNLPIINYVNNVINILTTCQKFANITEGRPKMIIYLS